MRGAKDSILLYTSDLYVYVYTTLYNPTYLLLLLLTHKHIQVVVRMRPLLSSEVHHPTVDLDINPSSNTIGMTHMGRDYHFHVDKIFEQGATQRRYAMLCLYDGGEKVDR